MAYRNHTPGGCCCDACFSVTDNFCDMDFSIPPEITWGDAPSYGWTNYQCYADGHPGPFRYQGMAPRAIPANLPGSVSPKFVGGIYEYDLVIDEHATATIIPEAAAASLVAVQIRRTSSNTCELWLARTLFRFGSDWSWAPLSNAQTFTHSGIGTRMRVRVWIKFPPGNISGAPLAKVFAAADEDLEDFTHLLTFNANKPAVPNALIVSQYPTVGEEWAAATALDVLQTTAPTAPQQFQNARVRHRKFRWQATSDWGGGSGCPTLTENDHVEGFATNIPFPETLRLTVTGCAHSAWNQVFPLTRTALTQPSSRIYETENKNWDNTGTIGAASGDYHVILRKIEAYIGTIGDLRFRLWFGVTLGLVFPLPTNGATNIITAQFDIAAPGANVLQDPRAMSAAYHVTGRPQHADDYTQLIFDSLLGQNATFTLALV